MASTLVGAPVSKGVMIALCGCSLLAAVTTTQHYFNVPVFGYPHISRDHQFWRFATRWFVWTNSSEVLLSVFILWYASLEVERIWGSRKFASFLVGVLAVSSAFELVALVVFSRAGLRSLPAGPFALIFAIVYQSHRLVPSLYTFELFHPRILLNNRYPLYVLSVLLLTSQPPVTAILGICGVLASALYTSAALPLWLQHWRLPTRVYDTLGKALSPLMGQNRPYRRTNIVTFEEALLEGLGGVATEQIFGTATATGGRRDRGAGGGTPVETLTIGGGGNAVRRRSAVQLDRATPTPSPRPDVPPLSPSSPEPPQPAPPRTTARSETRLPPISGASFLSQWQAGLSGGAAQPSTEQVAELTAIFPHVTRPEIVRALQENEMSVVRAAEALVVR